MPWGDTIPLACFAAALLIGSAAAVQLAGFFPAEARPDALSGAGGAVLVVALAASLALVLLSALWLGVVRLPWPAAVIATGLAVLFGPLLFQAVPESLRDSRVGTAIAAALNLALAALLVANIP